jgi:hypothetical protein
VPRDGGGCAIEKGAVARRAPAERDFSRRRFAVPTVGNQPAAGVDQRVGQALGLGAAPMLDARARRLAAFDMRDADLGKRGVGQRAPPSIAR